MYKGAREVLCVQNYIIWNHKKTHETLVNFALVVKCAYDKRTFILLVELGSSVSIWDSIWEELRGVTFGSLPASAPLIALLLLIFTEGDTALLAWTTTQEATESHAHSYSDSQEYKTQHTDQYNDPLVAAANKHKSFKRPMVKLKPSSTKSFISELFSRVLAEFFH